MKVGLYARVSTKDQTTDNQIIRLREYCQSRGYEVVGEYVDVASGKLTHRPQLDAMLKDAKKRRFDKIIAIKIDRIGRSLINLKNIVENLTTWGIGLEMVDQDIDTSSASGRLMISLLGAFAEYERELIVERTNDGIARARKQGKDIGRARTELSPYQIDKAKQIIEQNPNISARELASHFDGIGRTCLIARLRELGIYNGRKGGYDGVYKETSKNTDGREPFVLQPQKEGESE